MNGRIQDWQVGDHFIHTRTLNRSDDGTVATVCFVGRITEINGVCAEYVGVERLLTRNLVAAPVAQEQGGFAMDSEYNASRFVKIEYERDEVVRDRRGDAEWTLNDIGFDDEVVCKAYTSRERWNGWAKPYATEEEAKRFCQWWQDNGGESDNDGLNYIWDEDANGIWATYPGEEATLIEPEVVSFHDDQLIDLSLGLVWMEVGA